MAHSSRKATARRRAGQQRGMVTLEIAIGSLVCMVVAIAVCWGVGLLALQARCMDTAAQVARQLARADQAAASQAEGRAPRGAVVRTTTGDRTVTVTVSLDSRLGRLGPVHLHGQASADVEPGVKP